MHEEGCMKTRQTRQSGAYTQNKTNSNNKHNKQANGTAKRDPPLTLAQKEDTCHKHKNRRWIIYPPYSNERAVSGINA